MTSEEFYLGRQKKIDWRKKGLGWIPDYPDARDCCLGDLHEKNKPDSDEIDSSVDTLEDTLIKALSALIDLKKQSNSSINHQDLEVCLQTLQRKRSSNIAFQTVRVYKVLRRGDRGKEVAKLKACLLTLIHSRYLAYEPFEPEKPQGMIELLRWLDSDEFDEHTHTLVRQFQENRNLEPKDGVVGLDTYATLTYLFANPETIKQPEQGTYRFAHPQATEQPNQDPSLKKSRLISVPSLIPEKWLCSIFQELQRLKDSKTLDQQWQTFLQDKKFEFTNKNRTCCLTLGNISIHLLKDRIEILVLKCEPFDERSLAQLFQNEFSIVDPILSFILQTIAPIRQFENFVGAVRQGLKNFGICLDSKPFLKKLNGDWSSDQRSYLNQSSSVDQIVVKLEELATQKLIEKPVTVNDRESAWAAVKKFEELFKVAIKQLEEEISKLSSQDSIEDKLARAYLYFLLEEFVPDKLSELPYSLPEDNQAIANQSDVSHSPTNATISISKKELFEVVGDLIDDCPTDAVSQMTNDCGSTENHPNKTLGIFSLAELPIPINSNLYANQRSIDSKQTRNYLFLPYTVDLSFWCSDIKDQGSLNSCTAFAGIALLEYFANRSFNKYTDASPLFLYKAARNLMHRSEDIGASVRDTMKAMKLFGVPPEEYWPYQVDQVNEEPLPFCYSFAQNYQALKYFRLDPADISTETLLFQVKAVLAAGFPCMFGFTIYTSAYEAINAEKGYFPFPHTERDKVVGGHAVIAVGYSDYKLLDDHSGQGALLIRNSWGGEWGQHGYGWLPYKYVLAGLTGDWWSLFKSEWFDQDYFGLGVSMADTNVGSPVNKGQPTPTPTPAPIPTPGV
jgi:C1A family cysteine protease